MKKQLILSTLIISLSLFCITFARDQKITSAQQEKRNELFNMAEKYAIDIPLNDRKLLENKKQSYQKEYIIDNVFTGAVTILLGAINYLCLANQLNTTIEKKIFSDLAIGLSFFSYNIFNLLRENQAEKKMAYEQTKDKILKNHIVTQLKEIFEDHIITYIKNKYLHKPLITQEECKKLKKEELNSRSLKKLFEKLEKKEPLNSLETEELFNYIKKVNKIIESNNKSEKETNSTIKKVKKSLLSENHNESIPSEIRDAIKELKKITEYSNSKCEQIKQEHYYTGSHYKGAIIAGLFGLTNIFIWAT